MHRLLAIAGLVVSTLPAQAFVNFESPVTHGLALTPGAARLCAVNTPDARLAVFDLTDPDQPRVVAEIPVGPEPVAVAARDDDEVWVVSRLGDAVNVVSLARGCVVATIAVGDEPADVVFAGSPRRAFVSVSGPREVLVLDPVARVPLARVPVFGDEPRYLATDGARVWVAAHRSGNGTTVAPAEIAPQPDAPRGLPVPPRQGLIVDSEDPTWHNRLGVLLPDRDVFEIDAETGRLIASHAGVGTILFGLAVDPRRGDLWVANTEARNLVRYEPALRGHAVDNRVTRITLGPEACSTVFCLDPEPSGEPGDQPRTRALAQPTDVCFAPSGDALYIAAYGSDRIGVLAPDGRVLRRIDLATAADRRDPRRLRGPRALVHHPQAERLYVLLRVAHRLAVLDTGEGRVLAELPLGYDPTPAAIARGRGFLYSAELSGTGTMSCSSCHVDGDWDGLAWDLGDPGGRMAVVPNRGVIDLRMHPMKGPMTTQTLRGLTPDTAPFHHRGDRPALSDFNGSFETLLGGARLSDADMRAYVAFLQSLAFPPNPYRRLDGSYSPGDRPEGVPSGEELFRTGFNGPLSCIDCHLARNGTNGIIVPGLFLQYQAQPLVPPQLRDVYKRTARIPHDGLRMSGFGVSHDGSVDSVFDFLGRPFFRGLSHSEPGRRELEHFVLAFDTGTPPAVGWSCTLVRGAEPPGDLAEVERLASRGDCDLIAKGRLGGTTRGFVFVPGEKVYLGDDAAGTTAARAALLSRLGDGDALTFQGVPAGCGRRCGIDRDADGVPDGAEH